MQQSSYSLAEGEPAADRLALVQEIYGPSSRAWLREAELEPAMHVLELAAGTGRMTRWISGVVGRGGRVVAVDESEAQLDKARDFCDGCENLEFRHALASDTGLPHRSFDVVYMRLLLMHVPDAAELLAHAKNLLRPGGLLVCEEAAVDSTFTDPQVPAQRQLHVLAAQLAAERGVDYNIARRLGSLVRQAGFTGLRLNAHVPVFVDGHRKRLEVASFREAMAHWSSATPATRAQADRICDTLERTARDATTVYGLSTMMQLRARRPDMT